MIVTLILFSLSGVEVASKCQYFSITKIQPVGMGHLCECLPSTTGSVADVYTELQLYRFPNVAVSRFQYTRRRSSQPILKH
jgi:hypothetical protein